MFKLRYLECKDFFSFESVSIRFTKGMTIVTGYDEGGKDSNGCGKSSILNAICWALFGKTLKGVSGQDVVRWGQKNCKVILILEGEGHVYEIQRSIDKLVFKVDNKSIIGHVRDLQSAIEGSFKTNFALFIRSTAFSQSQVEFLAASGDAEKKKLFKEILSLSRLDKYYDLIKSRYDSEFNRARVLESEIETRTGIRSSTEEKLRQSKDAKEAWEGTKASKIEQLHGKRAKSPIPIEPIQGSLQRLSSIYNDQQDKTKEIKAAENKIIQLELEEDQHNKEIHKIQAMIDRGDNVGTRCEVCGSVVNKKMLGAHRREMEEKIEEVKEQREKCIKERLQLKDELQSLYNLMLSRDKILNDIKQLEQQLTILEYEWKAHKQEQSAIDRQILSLQEDPNPYDKYVEQLSAEVDMLGSLIKSLTTQFEDAKKSLDALAFLKFTLSREGAVSQIIEKEYATLVSYANRMLSGISNGKLRIAISPQKELKSGALKEEIDISIFVNDQKTPYWGASDGQRQRVNIALLLSLNKLCKVKGINSFDFLLLDEVLDLSLAEGGQQDVVNLLKDYMRECESIILISHQDAFKTSFTSALYVYRDAEGVSRLTR